MVSHFDCGNNLDNHNERVEDGDGDRDESAQRYLGGGKAQVAEARLEEEREEEERMDIDDNNENLDSKLKSNINIPQAIISPSLSSINKGKESFTLRSSSSSSSSPSHPHVHIDTQSYLQHRQTDNRTYSSQLASSPSIVHSNNTSIPIHPSSSKHAFHAPHSDTPVTDTQTYFTGQSLPTPTARPKYSHSYSHPISTSQSTPLQNRPNPLRLASSASSSSSSSLRSARRLNHSPYIIPSTAKLLPTSSPSMTTPTDLPGVTVKDEPRTPVPLPTSPLLEVKNEHFDEDENDHLQNTPKRSVHISPPSHSSSRIGSSPGSMSMSQRRGVRPSFPSPRISRQGSSNGVNGNGITNMRGLLTPQHSASGSGSASSSRQIPYPTSIPLISAPLSPPPGQRWHQSAPAVPLSAGIPPVTPGHGKSKQTNPYQVSLDEIPKDFVLKKLVQLASKYWYAPHSADCHIVVPIKRTSRSPTIPSTPRTAVPPLHQRLSTQPHVPQTANNGGPSFPTQPGDSFLGPSTPTAASIQAAAQMSSGVNGNTEEGAKPDVLTSSVTTMEGTRDFRGDRGGSLPGGDQMEQCLVFPLHKDYLTTQSVLFRTLLNSQAAHLPNPPPRDQDGRLIFQSPVVRGAKVLPTKSDRPKALYVPLPDPASFGVILHWLYWHDADHFNHCLSKGLVTWQGVIRNIEYLSLDNEIKLLAGKWWKRWVKPTETNERRRAPNTAGGPGSRISGNGSLKGKRRAFSASAAKRDKMMIIDHDDYDEDEDEDDEDSGDEADDEDIEVGNNLKKEKLGVDNDGFADHVSLRLGRL